ncbi:IS66 family insertion sequence element accessory protein TnpA [uncultured Desulfobacter sp.]|uniref:IS66 family insertion sequence element accessory protein TnpA n=1 Tax=uncultured Desulfobacter sp. TaxID=240139 RepID=UPI0029F4F4AC|nr:IS66 family insertion sequence element accessory protein TnpB [uncultured Desulfobacter sp.]
MSETEKKNQKLTQFWKYHIKQWSESGMSQNAYCRQNDLRPNQFTYWKMKFKSQALVPEFVQVPSTQINQALSLSGQKGLTLNTDNGFQIEIPDGFSQTTLAQVLQVLRRC